MTGVILAAIVSVSTVGELETAVAGAQAGDEIVLADGTYALAGLTCSADGSEAQPIVVRAATPHGARIEFDGVEGFKVTGPHWHFEDLEVVGVCAADDDCEHAFHVSGRADGFVLRGSRVVDFNAQLKVNAQLVGAVMEIPDRGLVEGCELYDADARQTGNPTTKLNIDTGDDWVVRGNVIRDFEKGGGDGVSYGVFLKSGGKRGVIERNLIMCTSSGAASGTRIGMSFGGGGTAPQFCAPAFDPGTPCDPEHSDGIMRNNVVVACSDVGVYLNRAAGTRVLYNTLIETAGVDFRFASSSGEAVGNLLGGVVRNRDGATGTFASNLEMVDLAAFEAMYVDPLAGDLHAAGDLSALAGGPARAEVSDDYCARARPAGAYTLGALEHSLGDCDTVMPPGSDGGVPGAPDGGPAVVDEDGDGGCGCRAGASRSRGAGWIAALVLVGVAISRRRMK